MKIKFICPHCRLPLTLEGRRFFCDDGHSYDISSEGYVNLLLPGRAHSKIPGDNREMVRARRDFLSGGAYSPFRQKLCELADSLSNEGCIAVDAGCGEGYYTGAVSDIIKSKGGDMYAFDISKFALKAASRSVKNAFFAVASCASMPFSDASCDLLVNIFSPLEINEVKRILVPGGHIIYAVPSPRHLYELKALLYDEPYENKTETFDYDGFEFAGRHEVRTRAELTSNEEIMNLFSMTPYYWRSPRAGVERLRNTASLGCSFGFDFLVYRKK